VGTLAVPLLAMVMSAVTAAALLLPIYVASDLVGLYLYRRTYSPENLRILIPAGLLGVSVGWQFSANLSSDFIAMLVGLVGLLFCLNTWFGEVVRKAIGKQDARLLPGLFWGTLTGLTSFVSHSGAATYQMYVLPQRLEKMKFAGTSTILFAIINAAKIFPYWELKQFDHLNVTLIYSLMPCAIAGTIAGRWLTQRLPDGIFFRAIQITLFGLSIKLIWDYLASIA